MQGSASARCGSEEGEEEVLVRVDLPVTLPAAGARNLGGTKFSMHAMQYLIVDRPVDSAHYLARYGTCTRITALSSATDPPTHRRRVATGGENVFFKKKKKLGMYWD
eukprot:SAG31_NODE_374_length_16577_cov_9.902173_10_plen_107_part_00